MLKTFYLHYHFVIFFYYMYYLYYPNHILLLNMHFLILHLDYQYIFYIYLSIEKRNIFDIANATLTGSRHARTGTLLGHWIVELIFVIQSILSLNGGQPITGYLVFDATTPLRALLLPATVTNTIFLFSYVLYLFFYYLLIL